MRINSEKGRAFVYQASTAIVLIALLWWVFGNMTHNIQERGIKTGFSFLDATAGFDISESPVPFTPDSTHLDVFVTGLMNTLIVSVWGVILSSILGLFIGIGRLSSNWLINRISAGYIEIFRNIPLLLQILFWYNVVLSSLPGARSSLSFFDAIFICNRGVYLPRVMMGYAGWSIMALTLAMSVAVCFAAKKRASKGDTKTTTSVYLLPGIVAASGFALIYGLGLATVEIPHLKAFNFSGGKVYTPEFLALLFALSIYTAAFIAEAVRSGIEAVPAGQKEAAASLGLSRAAQMRLVILPQAIRVAVPPIINQYLNLIKNSSLAAAIGYPELVTVFAGTSLNQTGQAVEIIAMTMVTYLLISLLVSLLLNYLDRVMKTETR